MNNTFCNRLLCRAALPILFSGCLIGPDFETPSPEIPIKFREAPVEQSANVESSPEMAEWWNVFADRNLALLIKQAVSANPEVRGAQARLRQARALRTGARAGLFPTVTGAASMTRTRRPTFSVSEGDGGLSENGNAITQNLFQAALDASWEIDIFGGTRREIEAAGAEVEAAHADFHATLTSLAAETALSYYQLREFQSRLDVGERNLEAQRQTADVVRQRFNAGFASALDLANAEAEAATTAAQLPQLRAGIKQNLYALMALLARSAADVETLVGTATTQPNIPNFIPPGLPSDLIRRRPDIRRAEQLLHAETARIGATMADFFPRFSLTGSGGYESRELKSLFEGSSRLWTFGPSANWLVFDAGRVSANVEAQREAAEQARAEYQRAILTALQEVETALVNYREEQQRTADLEQAVTANSRAVELSTSLYDKGLTEFVNVLIAERALYASEDALAQNRYARASQLISLFKALGGGWEKLESEYLQAIHS